ncbi:MAG: pyridoxal phosphate-dependent aminotransferase [Planctomycetota bacterium]|nr:MAG: pyridoxal phosphate-dependent aminotransferase [Planctomycetota bacterium]
MPETSSSLPLAARVASLQPSATLAMVARVEALRAQGVEVLSLTAGEPDFTPPKAAEEAGIRAIREGRGRYTAGAGMAELRAAAARMIQREIGVEYAPEEVIVTTGGKLGINQALMALVEPGDRVLVPVPCWTSYPEMVRIAGGEPVLVPCDQGFLPQVEDLDRAAAGARVLLLNTPNNPTGVVYPAELCAEIGDWAQARGLAVISDEIYAALTYHGARHVSPIAASPGLRESAVWIGGMSKAYAMTGWRMGFLAAPRPLARAISSLQSQLASSPNAISQIASLAALERGDEEREAMRRAFEARCELVAGRLAAMTGVVCPRPQGAFYAFPNVSAFAGKTDPSTGRVVRNGDDLAEILLEADRVGVIGGGAFGAPECFRISFAAAEEVLERALERIGNRLESLR